MVGWALIGREQELGRVEHFLARVREGSAALLIEGDPGIGKSALWRVASDCADALEYRVLAARPAEAERTLSFATLGDLFGACSDELGVLPSPQRRALRAALLLADAKGPPPEPRALGVALANLLRGLAVDSPVVVAVDDLQWVDPASAAALGFALRRLEDTRVGVLAAARAGEAVSLGSADVERLQLGSLPAAALGEVLSAELGDRLPRTSIRHIVTTSAGNPLYALELGRATLERGGAYDALRPPPPPDSLRVLVAARLERLSPSTRRALVLAAAAADPTVELLHDALGAPPELEPAVDAAVLERSEASVRFANPVFASVVYADASAADRRWAHAQLAEVVGATEERARHLAAAATAPDERVAHTLETAAAVAENRGAASAAAELAERAAELTPAGPKLWERRVGAAKRLFDAGDLATARTLLELALAEAPQGERRARALYLLGSVLNDADNSARAIECYREALRHAGDDESLRAMLHGRLAYVIQFVTGPRAAEADARRALDFAEAAADESLLADALAAVARIDFWLGRGVQREPLERAVALERRGAHLRVDLDPQPTLLLAAQLAADGALDEGRVQLRRLVEELRDAGKPLNAALHRLSLLEHRAGDWAAAETYANEALREARQAQEETWERFGLHALATVHAFRGDVEEARTSIDRCWPVAESAGQPTFVIGCRELLGFLALSLDDAAEAERQLAPAHATLRAMEVEEPSRFAFLPDEIEALIELGRLDDASAALAWLEERGRSLGRAWALANAARCRGLLLDATGAQAEAASAFEAALVEHGRLGEPFDRGRTLLAYGRSLRRRRQKRSARERLDEAVATFDDLGASLWAAKARRELGHVGGRAPRPGSLTETERTVAELVATGKSNHEVAQALLISPKTVEWNLSKVYRKLHVTSRTELAAKLARERSTSSD